MSTINPPLVTAQIAINTRTLRIGHQTYQLANLARVQTLLLPKPPEAGKGNKGLAWLGAIAVFLIIGVFAAGAAGSGGLSGLGLLLAVGAGVGIYLATKKPYQPMYALVLETTGAPVTALVSPDVQELERISGIIVAAIENPPRSEQLIQIRNVVLGDQYNQSGTMNFGRIGGRT
jgi:hypothetical protein